MEWGFLVLIVVQAAAEFWRLDEKPPVTTALLSLMTLVHFRPTFLPTIDQVYFNPNQIIMRKDLKRFFLSAFYHIDEHHLVHNMVSLLWTGIALENAMGSFKYTAMVAVLLCMSNGIMLLLAKILLFFNHERAYYVDYSAGFSCLLFAMKAVSYSRPDIDIYIYGFMIPPSYAAWVELLILQILFPGVSLLGHLGGILAGILYSYLKYFYSGPDAVIPSVSLWGNIGGLLVVMLYSSYSAPNPPEQVIMGLVRKLCWPLRYLAGKFQSSSKRFFGGGIVGRREASKPANSSVVWRCKVCTHDIVPSISKCEICKTERGVNAEMGSGSGNHSETPCKTGSNDELGAGSENLSVEELRRRRLERFTRRR